MSAAARLTRWRCFTHFSFIGFGYRTTGGDCEGMADGTACWTAAAAAPFHDESIPWIVVSMEPRSSGLYSGARALPASRKPQHERTHASYLTLVLLGS